MFGTSQARSTVWWSLCGLLAALSGCGDDRHESCEDCTLDGAVAADGGVRADATAMDAKASSANDAGVDARPDASDAASQWPTGPIRPTRYRIPDPTPKMAPCPAAGAGTVETHEVLLGQTHLTPSGWPFQTVSANRPLTVAIAVGGAGAAPSFVASVKTNGVMKQVCLQGADSLPSAADDLTKSLYRATIPAAWVAPGMSITVSGGGVSETLQPDVQAENGLTLYYVQARLFDAGSEPAPPSAAQWTEFLARLPVSYLDVGINPFGVWRPSKLLIDKRDDARSPSGETTTLGPLFALENPHCSSADAAAKKCAPNSGYGTMAGVLGMLDAFRAANGVGASSTWFADLTVALGGGLAGGERGTGDNAELTMNHELGHAWGFPHWAPSDTAYPYEGVHANVSGGFGDRWAFDQARDLLLAPTCKDVERQSPMQRSGGTCLAMGSWYDPYSDYEAARLLRMSLGASAAIMGTVAYHGGKPELNLGTTRAFTLPKEDGRYAMRFESDGPGFTRWHHDEASKAFVASPDDRWDAVARGELPVTMFAGAVIFGGESYFEEATDYVGNLLGALDPTTEDGFAYVKGHMSSDFYWAHDAVLRFTLDDHSTFTRLLSGGGALRAAGDTQTFAFNLPQELGHRVVKLELLSRPLGQYDATSRLGSGDSAASYLSKAKTLATWNKP
jgi:hypothetical protein